MTKHMTASPCTWLILACIAAPVAACAPPVTNAPPTSTGPNSNREPQSPSSLPRGFETPHPLLPRTGNLGTTGIGP